MNLVHWHLSKPSLLGAYGSVSVHTHVVGYVLSYEYCKQKSNTEPPVQDMFTQTSGGRGSHQILRLWETWACVIQRICTRTQRESEYEKSSYSQHWGLTGGGVGWGGFWLFHAQSNCRFGSFTSFCSLTLYYCTYFHVLVTVRSHLVSLSRH